jgi:hypothetical protein
LQIIDNNFKEVKAGEEGLIGIKVKPHRPLGLFSRYLVINASIGINHSIKSILVRMNLCVRYQPSRETTT